MRKADWPLLLSSITQGNCILMLGPDLSVADASGGPRRNLLPELARHLAKQVTDDDDEPFAFPNPDNLSQVAQKFVTTLSLDYLRDQVAGFFDGPGAPRDDDDVFAALAQLPFKLIVSSRLDDALEHHLTKAGRAPRVAHYNFRGDGTDYVDPGTVEQPLVYKLYGWRGDPSSQVVTESDLLDFLAAVVSHNPALPNNIRSAFQRRGTSFLFLGFGLRHWYLRILLHVLRVNSSAARSFALEEFPDGDGLGEARLFYKSGYRIHAYDAAPEDFVLELAQRLGPTLAVAHGTAPAATAGGATPEGSPTVFVSYVNEPEDVERTRGFVAELRRRGLRPIWDRADLETGDTWDTVLIDRVREADYFVVLQSPRLEQRVSSYVHEEVSVALKVQARMKYGLKYLLPVLVDGGPQLPQLADLHWGDLDADGGLDKLVSTIKRDFQRRGRR